MEEGNAIRLSPLRPGNVPVMSPSPRKSSPRGSRLSSSGRASRYDGGRTSGVVFRSYYCFRSNRVILWLLLITMWAYAGFYFQSRWAHGDNKEDLFSGGYGGENHPDQDNKNRRDLMANVDTKPLLLNHGTSKNMDVVPVKTKKSSVKKRVKSKSRRKSQNKLKEAQEIEIPVEMIQEEEIPSTNATYRFLVGPFGSLEDTVLGWSPETRSGTCDRKGAFARLVWSRKIVLIFHELSMTGAPLAMMELASEFLSCGATVSAVVLNRKGGLMTELARRKIRVISDKNNSSFRSAMKADLIIAGSAVCSSWIEQYLDRTILGSTQIIWWIMENRREYFDRSKFLLDRVKKLIFLSESQSKIWLAWCDEEKIQLNSEPSIIPLSVNDELAFVAGIQSSLNSPSFSVEKMQERRQALRSAVRHEMGLDGDDMLAISLSSLTPGKGQLLLLESANLIAEQGLELLTTNFSDGKDAALLDHDYYSRALLQDHGSSNSSTMSEKSPGSNNDSGSHHEAPNVDANSTKLILESTRQKQRNLKILIGSVGLKSNKISYVNRLLTYLSNHSSLSGSVLWTRATTHVASLYAAADVYVMNSQGLGETFGRVTIEAMAFGLPLLGTNAGGTMEIVEHNVTGLLHPLGRPGAPILAKNLEFLLENPSAREEMGRRGRERVKKMYLKKNMYQKFGEVLYKCMRIK